MTNNESQAQRLLGHSIRQLPNAGQIPSQPIVVQPIAYHEFIVNIKAHKVQRNGELRGFRLAEKSDGADRGRLLAAEVLEEKMQGSTGVNNVFHHHEVPIAEVFVQPDHRLHIARRADASVRGEFYKAHFAVRVEGTDEVGSEDKSPAQNADKQWVLTAITCGQSLAEHAHTGLYFGCWNKRYEPQVVDFDIVSYFMINI